VGRALRRLNQAGTPVFVVTNQRGVARGRMTLDDVAMVNDVLQRRLRRFGAHVDAFYVCPHEVGACSCRKPSPGLLLQAERDHPGLRLDRAVMVGDSESDVGAGLAVGAYAIRLGPPGTPTRAAALFADLASAVEALVGPAGAPSQPTSA
jgi:D-glycero-D-manno-heptose 1,7-bisphosphate phosphatase